MSVPTTAPVHGDVADGFGPVADVFRDNFATRGEIGAGLVVYVDGRPVVDLYGGIADPATGRPWTRDTPAVVFSCTKGILAVCAYLLVQADELDLAAPVTRYWPEFGANGKADIPLRLLFTHQAGLPALDRDLSREQVIAWDPVIAAIEEQRPLWEPGTAYTYHALTYGWLVGEVIRRVAGVPAGSTSGGPWPTRSGCVPGSGCRSANATRWPGPWRHPTRRRRIRIWSSNGR